MLDQKFIRELAKMDMKFSRVPGVLDRAFFDFGIRFLIRGEPERGEGVIEPRMEEHTPDRRGKTNMVIIEGDYEISPWGLEEARRDALMAAKDYYCLPEDIRIVEMGEIPKISPNRNFNVIYRIDILGAAIKYAAEQMKSGKP